MLTIFYFSRLPNRNINISGTAISGPKSLLSGKHICINFTDIDFIKKPSYMNGHKLVVVSKHQKLKIHGSGLANRNVINYIREGLREALRERKIYPREAA